MLLSVDQHGIENGATVINCNVSQQINVPGLTVDFYNRHMRTKRVCCVTAIKVKLVSEPTFDFLLNSCACQISPTNRFCGNSSDLEGTFTDHDVLGAGLQQTGRKLLALFENYLRSFIDS